MHYYCFAVLSDTCTVSVGILWSGCKIWVGEKVVHCIILCSSCFALIFHFLTTACCLALTWHELLSVCKTAPHFAWTSTPFHLSLHGYYTLFSSFLLYCTIATYGRGELRVCNRLPTRYWGNDAPSLLLWFVFGTWLRAGVVSVCLCSLVKCIKL